MEIEPEEEAKVKAKLTASNTPGMKPELESSQADNAANGQTAASPDASNGG